MYVFESVCVFPLFFLMFITSGSIPSELGNLSRLSVLYLYNNQLSGECIMLMCVHVSDSVIMTECMSAGTIPKALGELSQLTGLYLYANQLSGELECDVMMMM